MFGGFFLLIAEKPLSYKCKKKLAVALQSHKSLQSNISKFCSTPSFRKITKTLSSGQKNFTTSACQKKKKITPCMQQKRGITEIFRINWNQKPGFHLKIQSRLYSSVDSDANFILISNQNDRGVIFHQCLYFSQISS